MSTAKPNYVTSQPRPQDLHNTFDLMGNENFLRSWKFEEKSCGCTDSYYTTLTDTRLLLRSEDTTCCSCCCEPNHTDSAIFLRDIAEMREITDATDCCTSCWAKCCPCCSCCRVPKFIEIRGSFGQKEIYLDKPDFAKAQVEIPAAIGNHKLVSQY